MSMNQSTAVATSGKYVAANLSAGEHVRHVAKLHWSIYIPAALWALLAMSLMDSREAPTFHVWVWLIAITSFIRAALRQYTTEMAVTSKRVILKTGLVWRQTDELRLDRVETVRVAQGVLGRIFDSGTLTVVGSGGSARPFRGVANPLGFRNAVNDAADRGAS